MWTAVNLEALWSREVKLLLGRIKLSSVECSSSCKPPESSSAVGREPSTHSSHHRLLGKVKVRGLASKGDDKVTPYLQDRPCAYSEAGSLW